MSHFFQEELAALLALDALEPDEQADAELQLGSFPGELSGASAALAEIAADEPPADLRAAAIGHALEQRGAGRPVDAATPCDPVTGFRRTVDDLAALLARLAPRDWDAPAHPEHGTVRELMAHLVGVERLSVRWIANDPSTRDLVDHVEATRDVVDELATADPEDIALQWHVAALATSDAAVAAGLQHAVSFHDLTDTVAGLLAMRTFELWAHSMDIAAAAGAPRPALDDERMAALSGGLMAALPLGLAYRRTLAPGRTARIVLTGPAGGVYSVPLRPGERPGDPDVVLVADTVELCRVAARRLRPDELSVAIDGDPALADIVLGGLDAFARD